MNRKSIHAVGAFIVLSAFVGSQRCALAEARPPAPAPMMNEDLMGRLIKYARNVPEMGSVDATLCKIFNLCDGTADFPLKLAISDSTDGQHYIGIPPASDSRDILFLVKRDTYLEAYLTDRTGKLRAAAIST